MLHVPHVECTANVQHSVQWLSMCFSTSLHTLHACLTCRLQGGWHFMLQAAPGVDTTMLNFSCSPGHSGKSAAEDSGHSAPMWSAACDAALHSGPFDCSPAVLSAPTIPLNLHSTGSGSSGFASFPSTPTASRMGNSMQSFQLMGMQQR